MRKVIFPIVGLIVILSVIAGCGRKSAEELYTLAEQLEKNEKFEDALVKYERILVEYPETKLATDVNFKIAQIAGNLKQFQKCVDAYSKIVEVDPQNKVAPKAQFMIGYIYANELKKTDKAKIAYEKFLENYSEVDSGMTASANFELKFLGKDISEIDFLKNLTSDTPEENAKAKKGN